MMGVFLMVLCLISIPAAIGVPTTNNNTNNNSGLADRNEWTTASNAIAVAATVNSTTAVGDGKRFKTIYQYIAISISNYARA